MELTEKDLTEQRKVAKRDYILKNSPTIMERVHRVFAKKTQAALSLEEAEREVAEVIEQQNRCNAISRQKEELSQTLANAERTLKSLPDEIAGWQSTVRNHLLLPGIQAATQLQHAAGQVVILRVVMEELPVAIKALKQQIGTLKAELSDLAKTI